ncbi:MAG: hypothetical protein A2Z44_09270 [Betaproteobacteria bacterium RBG_19FT_COMBO_58_11]|nr:MAG: hypothetical protein A2Z44_09270 [Betaproteobacteria bacterium RBG_19FT_COMBO_58_11]
MTAGATQTHDLALGAISLGVTTLKRSGSKAAMMTGAEVAMIVTAGMGIEIEIGTGNKLSLTVPLYSSAADYFLRHE